jgi:hypothetical protein
MRRGFLLPVLLWSATTASAQAPQPLPPELPRRLEQLLTVNTIQLSNTGTTASVDDVVARWLSFDRDNDGRVTKSELPERLQPILPRGDADQDQALDLAEIRALSRRPPELTVRGFPQVRGGGYGFADEESVSSLSHIQESLEDLRLVGAARDKALALVTSFSETLDADANKQLLAALQPLLTEEQMADFTKALDVRNPRRFVVSRESQGRQQVLMFSPSLSLRVDTYGLSAAQKVQAVAAIERFKERLRPGEQDRAALLDQMKGILTEEERDDFRAALQRRPVVKSGGVVGGVAGGVLDRPVAMPIRSTLLIDAN